MATYRKLELPEGPDLQAAANRLSEAFLNKVRFDKRFRHAGPGVSDWQRPLERAWEKDDPGWGLSQSTISDLTNARPKAYGLDTLLKLRRYTGLSLDELLDIVDGPRAYPAITEADVRAIAEDVIEKRSRDAQSEPAQSGKRKKRRDAR